MKEKLWDEGYKKSLADVKISPAPEIVTSQITNVLDPYEVELKRAGYSLAEIMIMMIDDMSGENLAETEFTDDQSHQTIT